MSGRRLWRLVVVVVLGLGLPMSAGAQDVVEYYGTDAIGSVRIVFDAAGIVVGRMDYGPFGEQLSASTVGHKSYAGLFRDGETSLDYAQARSYQVRTGRFNAPDPVYAGVFVPQAWNRYSYALNSPLNFVDPTGLQADSCTTVDSYSKVGDDWVLNTTLKCKTDGGGGSGGGGGGFWADLTWFLGTWFDRLTDTAVLGAPDGGGGTGDRYTPSTTAQNIDTGVIAVAVVLPVVSKSVAGKVVGAAAGKTAAGAAGASLPILKISAQKMPQTAQNISHALKAGHPEILTYLGHSPAARPALAGVPNIKPLWRDEYPFNATLEGGAGSWVGHVSGLEQRLQGLEFASFIQLNRLTAGSRFRVVVVP